MPIADCDTPAQAIEMSAESRNPETAPVIADWVVGDAGFEPATPPV